MDYLILLTFVAIGYLPFCNTHETELCYLRESDNTSNLCHPPKPHVQCCHGSLADISVTVYGNENCSSAMMCDNTNYNCCSRLSQQKNITDNYRSDLEQSFMSNCFQRAAITTLPFNIGLDLVVVSYNCRESRPNVAAAVAVSVTIVVVGAAVVGTIFYMRRRRSRKDATEQRKEIHTNNAYIGSVSRSIDLHQNAQPSIKAEDQSTNHYYAEIADNSVHFNHSSTEDNEYQPIKPNERTATNGPPTNSYTTDKDPTGKDEYDHLGTQDIPSSRANNYEHITHISKADCHSIFYDKTEFNKGNTISLDDEDNYNHAQQSAAVERTETDDRDGGYSHVGGTVGGPEADDQYSTMESVMDTQDGSRHLNNYFVLEKQY